MKAERKTGSKSKKAPAATPRRDVDKLTLPTKPSTPIKSLTQATTLIFGEPKIGKTSLAARFPGAFFCMFEPGGKGLSIYQRPCPLWRHFVRYVDLVLESDQFHTVIMDTVDKAYDRVLEATCQQKGVDWPSEGQYGDVWKAIKTEFDSQINRLIAANKGVILISHATVRTFQARSGGTYDKVVPTMGASCSAVARAIADVMGFYGFYGSKRYLTIQGSDEVEAGNRLESHFLTTKGEPVHSVPMGGSADDAYKNLLKAFNNEQKTTGEPSLTVPVLSNTPAKREKKR